MHNNNERLPWFSDRLGKDVAIGGFDIDLVDGVEFLSEVGLLCFKHKMDL